MVNNKYHDDDVDYEFLSRYIVPNWWVPYDLGLEDDEVTGFKEYLSNVSCNGYFEPIMEGLIAEYRKTLKESK